MPAFPHNKHTVHFLHNWLLLDRHPAQCKNTLKTHNLSGRPQPHACVVPDSALCVCVCKSLSVNVYFCNACRLLDISYCHWGCDPRGHSMSLRKTGKLKILLCISKTHILCIGRMQRNSHPHTNTPQSLSLCSLPQKNCAEDISYLTTLPSSDISPHKCAHITAHKHRHM